MSDLDGQTPNADQNAGGVNMSGGSIGMAIAGAVAGAGAGYAAFYYLAANHGLLLPLLPGAMVGIVRGAFARTFSIPVGIFCGLLGFGAGTYAMHTIVVGGYPEFTAMNWGLIALGAVLGAWFGIGRK